MAEPGWDADEYNEQLDKLSRMTVEQLLAVRASCDVCIGYHPAWYGHDRNPPCQGAAREEIMRRAHAYRI